MRHMVTCFSEHAVRISELSCSSSSSSTSSSSTFLHPPSLLQNAVVYLYKTPLNLLITVTWSRNHLTAHGGGGLSITFPSSPSTSALKLNRLFRRKKGQKTIEFDSFNLDILWDLSQATYNPATPEPVDGFYVIITSGTQLGLALGDPAPQGFGSGLISRREHYSGGALYCTTGAQFCEAGGPHEIVIGCGEENVLTVSIDKKTAVKIRRLQWNFRGNQTVFVDGVLVDFMWDVHDWFFGIGQAVFMFKARSGLDSARLWLDDKLGNNNNSNNQIVTDFSLLIYATKNA